MFGDVVSKAHEAGLIKSLGLVVLLQIIRCWCQVFNTEESAHYSKEIGKELSTTINKGVRRDAEMDKPMIREDILIVRGVVLDVGIPRVSLKYLSAITSI